MKSSLRNTLRNPLKVGCVSTQTKYDEPLFKSMFIPRVDGEGCWFYQCECSRVVLFQTISDKLKMIQIGYQTGQSHVSVFALPKSVSQVADSTHSWQCWWAGYNCCTKSIESDQLPPTGSQGQIMKCSLSTRSTLLTILDLYHNLFIFHLQFHSWVIPLVWFSVLMEGIRTSVVSH